MKNDQKFTRKELHKLSLRWVWQSQIGWNYERMQGLGYLSSMIPVIDKLYGHDKELKMKALRTHAQFFNTTPQMGNIIIGMDIAIEEQNPTAQGIEVAASIKTALMGPFAGIGDTIFGMIAGALFGSIAASMAVNGSALGIMIWIAWNIFVFFIRFKLFDLGYNQGANLVTSLANQMNAVTEAAAVLGLTVIGGMIAQMVKFPLKSITINMGIDEETGEQLTNTLPLQTYANSIMPALLPALFAWACYKLLGKKWCNSNRLIWMVIAFALLCSLIGIAG